MPYDILDTTHRKVVTYTTLVGSADEVERKGSIDRFLLIVLVVADLLLSLLLSSLIVSTSHFPFIFSSPLCALSLSYFFLVSLATSHAFLRLLVTVLLSAASLLEGATLATICYNSSTELLRRLKSRSLMSAMIQSAPPTHRFKFPSMLQRFIMSRMRPPASCSLFLAFLPSVNIFLLGMGQVHVFSPIPGEVQSKQKGE